MAIHDREQRHGDAGLCVVVAVVSYSVIEEPFLRLRRNWSGRSQPTPAPAVTPAVATTDTPGRPRVRRPLIESPHWRMGGAPRHNRLGRWASMLVEVARSASLPRPVELVPVPQSSVRQPARRPYSSWALPGDEQDGDGEDVMAIIDGRVGPLLDGRMYHDPAFVAEAEA